MKAKPDEMRPGSPRSSRPARCSWATYERLKRDLRDRQLRPAEYEAEVRALAKRLRV